MKGGFQARQTDAANPFGIINFMVNEQQSQAKGSWMDTVLQKQHQLGVALDNDSDSDSWLDSELQKEFPLEDELGDEQNSKDVKVKVSLQKRKGDDLASPTKKPKARADSKQDGI